MRMQLVFDHVFVRDGYVGVACLVFCHCKTHGADGIGDARVLQAVELVVGRETEGFAHHPPAVGDGARVAFLRAGHEVFGEKVITGGIGQHTQFYHQPDDPRGQGGLAVLAVLADGVAHEDRLLLHRYVTHLQAHEFVGADEGVVEHHADKEKGLVVLIEVVVHPLEVGGREGFPELVVLPQVLDALHGVHLQVAVLSEKGAEYGNPQPVVVPGSRAGVSVDVHPFEEGFNKWRV